MFLNPAASNSVQFIYPTSEPSPPELTSPELLKKIQINEISPHEILIAIKNTECRDQLTHLIKTDATGSDSITLKRLRDFDNFTTKHDLDFKESLEKFVNNYNDPYSDLKIEHRLSKDAQFASVDLMGKPESERTPYDLQRTGIVADGNEQHVHSDYLRSDEFFLAWLNRGSMAGKVSPNWEPRHLFSAENGPVDTQGKELYPKISKDFFLDEVAGDRLSLAEIFKVIDADLQSEKCGEEFLKPLYGLVKSEIAPLNFSLNRLRSLMEFHSGDLHGALDSVITHLTGNPAMRENCRRLTQQQQLAFLKLIGTTDECRTEEMLFDAGVTTTPDINGAELTLFKSNDFLVRWLNSEDALSMLEKLKEPKLFKINWQYANFSGMEISYWHFHDCDFKGANFNNTDIRKCNFRGVKNWEGATIYGGGIEDCKDIYYMMMSYDDDALQLRLEARGLKFTQEPSINNAT